MYAIIDIETTGGKYNEEGITEIAIYQFDGHEITDQFVSLVNPERQIQPFVVGLTGINSSMLVTAPKFYELAKRIVGITQNCILVAHNAEFDYRVLKLEFKRLGFDFTRDTLCTVELSKKLLPNKESYSLGKLLKAVGIPIKNRHRADGDARATVELFKLLLSKDLKKDIVQNYIITKYGRSLTPNLLEILDTLPDTVGVYYMYNKEGEIIYIGKSKNIKKRVNQHFTGISSKAVRLQKEVVEVGFEKTGSELIALLKESEEIKIHKPKYNKAQKRSWFGYGLYSNTTEKGYTAFKVEKIRRRVRPHAIFGSYGEGRRFLTQVTDKYTLCQKVNGLYQSKTYCFYHSMKKCNGACMGEEDISDYNERAQRLVENSRFDNEHMLIIDTGREPEERSVIVIEDGRYRGFGFYNLNYQIGNADVLRNVIVNMPDNRDTRQIIQSYLRRKKVLKIVPLDSD